MLLVGAVNVLNGHLAQFTSRASGLRIEHILASCAVPSLFPAVEFDGGAYWDGLFSDNPPINEMIRARCVGNENIPDEIWVIKINATGASSVPVSPDAIADRRNELVGNVSLFQQLRSVGFINDLLLGDAFRPEFLRSFDVRAPIGIPKCYREEPDRPYHIPCIEMSPDLQESLDHASKLDRGAAQAARLMADGERQARAFLEQRGLSRPTRRAQRSFGKMIAARPYPHLRHPPCAAEARGRAGPYWPAPARKPARSMALVLSGDEGEAAVGKGAHRPRGLRPDLGGRGSVPLPGCPAAPPGEQPPRAGGGRCKSMALPGPGYLIRTVSTGG